MLRPELIFLTLILNASVRSKFNTGNLKRSTYSYPSPNNYFKQLVGSVLSLWKKTHTGSTVRGKNFDQVFKLTKVLGTFFFQIIFILYHFLSKRFPCTGSVHLSYT